MYWLRTVNPYEFLIWLSVTTLWTIGGWLIATHAFDFFKRERLLVGFGLGLTGFLWITNVIGRWLPTTVAFVGSGIAILLIGLAFAWRGKRPVLDIGDLGEWKLLLFGAILLFVILRIQRGVTIMDDGNNLALISTMAAGDIPPHYLFNPDANFLYHYGFQLFGASMMRLGGLLPWSAYDLSKAIASAYSFILAYLVGRRFIKHSLGGISAVFFSAFIASTLYLMLLLPSGIMSYVDQHVIVDNPDPVNGMPLSEALGTSLSLRGGPPIQIGFAYLGGIMGSSKLGYGIFGGPGIFSGLVTQLIILGILGFRRKRSFIPLIVLFAFLGLTSETSYVLYCLGLIPLGIITWRNREVFREHNLDLTLLALLVSLPIVMIQGGTLTEVTHQLITGISADSSLIRESLSGATGFSIRWPPAIISTRLGELHLHSPPELLTALFEIGPVLFLTPWITAWAWRRRQSKEWIFSALMISSWVTFLLPIFFQYYKDRDFVRVLGSGISLWVSILTFAIWDTKNRWPVIVQQLGIITLAVSVFGGIYMTGVALTSTSQSVIADGITGLDSRISTVIWDELPEDALVFDAERYRAVILTGRLTRAATGNTSLIFTPHEHREELINTPTIRLLRDTGFDFVYMDDQWWIGLSPESQTELSSPCVGVWAEQFDHTGTHFRKVLDLRACSPEN